MLVVFGDDVIIFSDKSCAYPNTGKGDLDWKRWWKRAVAESVKQISGAERWLRQYPERVYADNRCSKRLDVEISGPDSIRVHRVIVALNARERCQRFFGSGSGSLMVWGSAHEGEAPQQPFRIEGAPPGAPFVHVLDDVALGVLMSERDTVGDFVEYLTKKEQAMSLVEVRATGEEDLLAHYLMTLDKDGRYAFCRRTLICLMASSSTKVTMNFSEDCRSIAMLRRRTASATSGTKRSNTSLGSGAPGAWWAKPPARKLSEPCGAWPWLGALSGAPSDQWFRSL